MYTNLMGSTCQRNGAKKAEAITGRSELSEPSFNKKFRLRRRTRRVNHLFEPNRRVLMFALTIQGSFNDLVLPLRPLPNDRKVFLAELMSLHRQPKIARRRRGFCNQYESTGFPVEPVHDGNLSAAGDLKCQQIAQLFPERRRTPRFCRVNQQKRRLVDDDVVISLIDDFEVER
jgi:hypothetical protein